VGVQSTQPAIVPRLFLQFLSNVIQLLVDFSLTCFLLHLALFEPQKRFHPILQERLGMVITDHLCSQPNAKLSSSFLLFPLLLLPLLFRYAPTLLLFSGPSGTFFELRTALLLAQLRL
jgi:hypothetical protein